MNSEWVNIIAAFSALLSCFSTIILLITAFILRSQVSEMRKATYADAYKAAVDILQADDVREARKIVFRYLTDKPLEQWNEEEKDIAEKVCSTYDLVGLMVREGMLPEKFIVDGWGASLRKSWRILSPMIVSYRAQRNSLELWDDYERLAKEAEKFHKPLYSSQ